MNTNKQYFGLFPLRIFLFPGEQTTLHIFEPRYLQLINECLNKNEAFGIPYQGKTTLSELGSLVKVIQILKKYDNGELDVLVECSTNFKINHFEGKKKDKLYPCGTILQIIKSEFNPSEELKDHAKSRDLGFLTSPYSKDLIDFTSDLLDAIKIGSGDITWTQIIPHTMNPWKRKVRPNYR